MNWRHMKTFRLSLVLFFILQIGWLVQAEEKPEVRPQMQEFFGLTQQIHGFLIDKAEYLNEKNDEKIRKTLVDFAKSAEEFKKSKMSQSEDMKFQAQQISESLKEAEETFRNGFKDYSFWVLKSALNNCYNCHTQKNLPSTTYKFDGAQGNELVQADYLFLVRNYPEALPIYKKLVLGYPKNKITSEQITQILEKYLYYLVRVQHDDVKSSQLFDELSKNKKLPQADLKNMKAWKNYLGLKKYRIVEELMIKDQKRLEEWIGEREIIAKHYSYAGQRIIVDLETSQHLFKLLETGSDKTLRPWLLYWLADVDRNYRLSLFDSTPELYLKECIVRFSKSPAAKKCFALYKEIKTVAFTGSRGTELPKSVQDQLKKYEDLIK